MVFLFFLIQQGILIVIGARIWAETTLSAQKTKAYVFAIKFKLLEK